MNIDKLSSRKSKKNNEYKQLSSDLIGKKENQIRQQLADEFESHPIFQIPWFHHVQINTKCKSAINHQKKKEADGPTIGMIICKTKDSVEVQYSLAVINQHIGVWEYQLAKILLDNLKSSLPNIEELEEQLGKMNNE
jgi:hypothetical protein